jgi:hypothetical protein
MTMRPMASSTAASVPSWSRVQRPSTQCGTKAESSFVVSPMSSRKQTPAGSPFTIHDPVMTCLPPPPPRAPAPGPEYNYCRHHPAAEPSARRPGWAAPTLRAHRPWNFGGGAKSWKIRLPIGTPPTSSIVPSTPTSATWPAHDLSRS